MSRIDKFMEFVDKYAIVRRTAFFFVLFYLTPMFASWTIRFADSSDRPGLDVAAIIAAVWAPMTWLQKAVFELYNTARQSSYSQMLNEGGPTHGH